MAMLAACATATGFAAVPTDKPFAVFKAGGAVIECSREGSFILRRGGETLITGAQVIVACPEWKEAVGQLKGKPLPGYPKKTGDGIVFKFSLTEPSKKVEWLLEQTVSQDGDGVRFRYEVAPVADTECAEVSLFIDLPFKIWRGRRGQLWPQGSFVFPVSQPPRRHFYSAVARKVILGDGGKKLTLAFDTPLTCTVQDLREFGTDGYQVYPMIRNEGRVAAGQTAAFEFRLIPADKEDYKMGEENYAMDRKLAVGTVHLPGGTVGARIGDLYEIEVDVAGSYKTPFDPDQIRVDGHFRLPSGKETVVPAFFTRDFEMRSKDGREWCEPLPQTGWRVRFAPVEPGAHEVYVTARDRSGGARSVSVKFNAVPSESHGYIRVSNRDRRYFEFDDSTPYFAVGENIATYNTDFRDYDSWMGKLGKAGANYGRIWVSSGNFGFEWGPPGTYRMQPAWELDHVIRQAERNGIYIKLCLESWRYFEGDGSFYRSSDIHPYWKRNGGPCDTEMEVFTNEEARRMFRNRLRYVVARWGYSTHILAWEFWNEINCVKGFEKDTPSVVKWTGEMGRYLHKTDPWRHMVVNSLGSFVLNDDFWRLPEMDFAQVHGYWHPTLDESREAGKDMAGMVPAWIDKISGYGKPALFAEYGLVNETWGPSPLADKDTEGVHLHNGMWSAIMTGSCGTAMLWWWDTSVDRYNLYPRFASIARFVEGIPWTTAGFKRISLNASAPEARAMALAGNDKGKVLALAWVQNHRHTWWNVVHGEPIPPLPLLTVTVPGLPDGGYQVERWDTWKGASAGTERLRAKDGKLAIEIRDLDRDVAFKIRGE